MILFGCVDKKLYILLYSYVSISININIDNYQYSHVQLLEDIIDIKNGHDKKWMYLNSFQTNTRNEMVK